MMRVLGIDCGLRHTGWGIIDTKNYDTRFIACGQIGIPSKLPISQRLFTLYQELNDLMDKFIPDVVSVEDVFINKNAASSLKLGYARAIALMVPAKNDIPVFEYANRTVKQAITGSGRAEKEQVNEMVIRLLPEFRGNASSQKAFDASDALAVALCHIHNASIIEKLAGGESQ